MKSFIRILLGLALAAVGLAAPAPDCVSSSTTPAMSSPLSVETRTHQTESCEAAMITLNDVVLPAMVYPGGSMSQKGCTTFDVIETLTVSNTPPSPPTTASPDDASTSETAPPVRPRSQGSPALPPSTAGLSGNSSSTISSISGATGSVIPDPVPSVALGETTEDAVRKALYLRTTILAFWLQALYWLGVHKADPDKITAFRKAWTHSAEAQKLLNSTLVKSRTPASEDCNPSKDYHFAFRDVPDILQQGLVATYMGIGASLDLISLTEGSDPDIAMKLASILAMDARHNEYFRQQNNLEEITLSSGEARIPVDWSLTWASQSIADHATCPKLPSGVKPAPRLDRDVGTSATSGVDKEILIGLATGGVIDMSVKPKIIWLSGLYSPTYSTVKSIEQNKYTTKIPKGLEGVAFLALVRENYTFGYPTLPNDELIAGPAIVQIS